MNFLALGFVDTSAFTAILLTRHRNLIPKADGPAPRVLPLRRDEEDLDPLKDWKSAKALLARMKTAVKPHLNDEPAVIINAYVEILHPGEGSAWTKSDKTDVWRTRTCLVPSPGGVTFVGPEGAILPVGQITGVDHLALCSDINTGPCARIHLVVDFLKAIDEPDQD